MVLADSNQPSGALAAANKEIMYEFDLLNGDLQWNSALSTHFGYPATEPIRRLEWWIEHVHPDDAMLINEAMDRLEDPKVPNWKVDYRFRKADGSYVLVHDTASILRDENGRALKLIGTIMPTA